AVLVSLPRACVLRDTIPEEWSADNGKTLALSFGYLQRNSLKGGPPTPRNLPSCGIPNLRDQWFPTPKQPNTLSRLPQSDGCGVNRW
ncbi:MAG TPA: hypothetical protein VHM88_09275, partial [Candidatus Acidoferrales bacterium]|nr:hypothetical protein [Candidatus Acidoferrales bacterium]